MSYARLGFRLVVLIFALALGAYLFAYATAGAQNSPAKNLQPDLRRALASRTKTTSKTSAAARARGYTPQRGNLDALLSRPRVAQPRGNLDAPQPPPTRAAARATAHPASRKRIASSGSAQASALARIRPGTSLGRILHTSQLSLNSSAGSVEQFTDTNFDLAADERATFDTQGGAFDIAVGRSGTRYEAYTALDDRGTFTTNDDRSIGVLTTAFDTNGDYTRDAASFYDLYRDFGLPSAAA
ncbi:MAG TPA: hypothetical protein VGO96_20005, partial [Pyrinomonadaceae bacterium]|nr:hypothetical protein [Pyrinomonadaceae bacterium]